MHYVPRNVATIIELKMTITSNPIDHEKGFERAKNGPIKISLKKLSKNHKSNYQFFSSIIVGSKPMEGGLTLATKKNIKDA